MIFSYENTALWNPIISYGILAGMMLISNVLLRKVAFIRKLLIPTPVLAGFLLLLLREFNVINISSEFLETVTYHAIAIGFIAMSLRVPNDDGGELKGELIGLKSGAVIIGSYLIQGIVGLAITVTLGYTIMPGLFKAAGILLPMGYGQGPGQANNVGLMYEQMGFANGQSFGLSIAAAGYLCACTVGVIYLSILRKKGKIAIQNPPKLSGSTSTDCFEDKNEIPISESVDRFSVQLALVLLIYLATFLLTKGITTGLNAIAPGIGKTVNSILWGFNFIVGSVLAMACRAVFCSLRKVKIMTRQYQNSYLLNRISGAAFDFMIICGIASIDISDMQNLWLPFILMAVSGCIVTHIYLKTVCKKTYPGYFYEGYFSMFGMMTGTISSGVLLLREIDPYYRTPAANNLVTGSSFAIVLGAPMLAFVSLAPQSETMLMLTFGLLIAYFAALMLLIYKIKPRVSRKK
ncbi:MAG: hypothetical protein RRZ24_04405 [Clostridia bacterium]